MAERKKIANKLRQYAKTKQISPSAKSAFSPNASGLYPTQYNDMPAQTRLQSAPRSAFDAMIAESRQQGVQSVTQLIDPGEMYAQKSLSFNKYVLDFINDTGYYGNANPYTDQQLLMAYMSSVYLFAALRRVANLVSRIKIVAEIEQDGKYVRAPETALINRIFEKEGASTYSRMYLNYAIYGASVIFKTKTLKAVMEHARGNPIYDYKDQAVAGLHVLDKPYWELDEDTYNGEINGIYVQRGTEQIGNRNYLERREFVYMTDWNPENPNRGRGPATVAIHEAVTNAAIARWSAEYFTRGAMPFVLVAMEEDPAMIADADLMKYKRQFEDHWQGVNSSLRSVFIDRKVEVQQVGIPAGEVAADELNSAALEGIAAAVGLDRELVVTPAGGSQERHAVLVKRAWEDTVIPLSNAMVSAFSRDLGLPDDMRLVLDLSHINELDADREQKSGTELQIYNDGMQTYNETRARLNMPTIPDFDGMLKTDEGLVPIDQIAKTARVPSRRVMEAYDAWWDKGLASYNDYRDAMGMRRVSGLEDVVMIDGRPVKLRKLLETLSMPSEQDLQREADLLERGLRTFNEARSQLGLEALDGMDDVMMMDGRPIRYREFLKHLTTPTDTRFQQQNELLERGLITFNQMRQELGLATVEGMDDVFMMDGRPTKVSQLINRLNYPSEDYVSNQVDLLERGLQSFNAARTEIGLPPLEAMDDVFMIDGRPVRFSALQKLIDSPPERQIDIEMQLFDAGIQSVNEIRKTVGLAPINELEGWYMADGRLMTMDRIVRQDKFLDDKLVEQIGSLWADNLIRRSKAMEVLGIEMGPDEIDGYRTEVEGMMDLRVREAEMQMEFKLDMIRMNQEQELDLQRMWKEIDIELERMKREGEMDRAGEFERMQGEIPIELERMRKEMEVELDRMRKENELELIQDRLRGMQDMDVRRSEADLDFDNFLREGKEELRRDLIERQRDLEFERKTMIMEAETDMLIEKMEEAAKAEAEAAGGDAEGDDDQGGGSDAFGGWRSIDDDPDGPDKPDGPDDSGGGGGYAKKPPFRPDGYIEAKSDRVNVSGTPHTDGEVLGQLAQGDVFQIVGRTIDSNWIQILVPEGDTGWVQVENIKTDHTIELEPITWTFDTVSDFESLDGGFQELEIPEIDEFIFDDNKDASVATKSEEQYMSFNNDKVYDDKSTNQLLKPPSYFGVTESEAEKLAKQIMEELRHKRIAQSDEAEAVTTLNQLRDTVPDREMPDIIEGDSAFLSLWIGRNEVLEEIQSEVRQKMSYNPDIEWVDPNTFHVTLVYVKGINDDDLESVKRTLPSYWPHIELEVGPLSYFSNEYETVIYMTVQPSKLLERLQQRLHINFGAYGALMSAYSNPATYTPHITLGYAPAGTIAPPYDRHEIVSPEKISIGRDDYVEQFHIPFQSNQEILGDHDEPDGTQMVMGERQAREEQARWKMMLRENWKSRIKAWQHTGVPPENVPPKIMNVIMSSVPKIKSVSNKMLDATIKAIDQGLFDDDVKDVKPSEMFMKAYQREPYHEIRAWEKKTINGYKQGAGIRKGIAFEVRTIPNHLKVMIRQGLMKASDESDIREVFVKARQSLDDWTNDEE